MIDWLAVAAVAVTGAGWLAERQGWFDPAPYYDVHNVSAIAQNDDTVLVSAEYTLTDRACEFLPPIMIFGWVFGDRVPLQYTPIRQSNQGAQRYAGHQLMRLSVDLGDVPALPHLEVWTRHDCDGRIVERMMLEADVVKMPAEGCCP